MKRPDWVFLLLFCCPLALGSDSLSEAQVSKITGNLMCTCSCPHLIRQCGDECGVAPQLVQEIRQLVAAGKTEQEVYSIFERKYGTSVRAVPKAQGFNLLAWVLPFVGLLVGAVVVVVVARSLKPDDSSTETEPLSPPLEEKYRQLLERELRE